MASSSSSRDVHMAGEDSHPLPGDAADPAAYFPPHSGHRKRHAHALVDDLFCVSCQVYSNSEASFLRHRASRQHRAAVASRSARRGVAASAQLRGGEPFDRLSRTTATASLAMMFNSLWGTFGAETVQALFLLRRQTRVIGRTQASDRLRDARTVEDYAALLLSVPNLVVDMAGRARAILACTDLPQHEPTLRLTPDQRLTLRREWLYRAFYATVLGDDLQLLLAAVHAALRNGTARALITDAAFDLGYLASKFASLVSSTAAIPGSPFHHAWHADDPSLTPSSRGRRGSDSDLAGLAGVVCDCRSSSSALRAVEDDARELKREYFALLLERRADSEDSEEGERAPANYSSGDDWADALDDTLDALL